MDQDGKSKSASAVDEAHYPAVTNEKPNSPVVHSTEDIAQLAYQIWIRQGCPEGRAEDHWLEAERQLTDAELSRRLTEIAHQKGGSVQSE